jgi:hypothetical protein
VSEKFAIGISRSTWFVVLAVTLLFPTSSFGLDVEALNDTFEGDWKECLWQGYQTYGGDTYKEGIAGAPNDVGYDPSLLNVVSNRFDISIPAEYLAGMSWHTGLVSRFSLQGDFSMVVEYFLPSESYWTNLDMRGLNILFIELMAGDAGARRRQVRFSGYNTTVGVGEFKNHLWVAHHMDGTVSQLDTLNGTVLGTYKVGGPGTGLTGSYPSRTSVDLVGNVWTHGRGNSTVSRIDASLCSPPSCSAAEMQANHVHDFDLPYISGWSNWGRGLGGGVAADKNNDVWAGMMQDKIVTWHQREDFSKLAEVRTDGEVYGMALGPASETLWVTHIPDMHGSGTPRSAMSLVKIDTRTHQLVSYHYPVDRMSLILIPSSKRGPAQIRPMPVFRSGWQAVPEELLPTRKAWSGVSVVQNQSSFVCAGRTRNSIAHLIRVRIRPELRWTAKTIFGSRALETGVKSGNTVEMVVSCSKLMFPVRCIRIPILLAMDFAILPPMRGKRVFC